jgi:hypothetical protein
MFTKSLGAMHYNHTSITMNNHSILPFDYVVLVWHVCCDELPLDSFFSKNVLNVIKGNYPPLSL